MKFTDFRNKVIEKYANNVSIDKIKKHILKNGNYIWHLFSFELIDKNRFLIGEDAKKAYDQCDKSGAIVYHENKSNHFFEINDYYMSSEQIQDTGEIYIFAKDYSWVYFGTHEECIGLGPYLIKEENTNE